MRAALFKKPAHSATRLFISIGAGQNQLPLIEEAKRLGLSVVGVDRNPRAAGIARCDLRIFESVDNYRGIFAKIKDLLIYGDIVGVLSKSYGSAVKSACYIANRFQMPMIPYRRVDDFINKKRMKAVFSRYGIPSPCFVSMESRASIQRAARLGFPLVVKPVIGHAKMDVGLVEHINGLKEIYEAASLRKVPMIAERFIPGDEIIAAGVVYNGRYHLVAISDKLVTPVPHFVDLMHVFPSIHARLAPECESIGQRIADAFEISLSPLIMELKIDEQGSLSLIEAVPEFGGEFIPDILIPEGRGYNLIQETVRAISARSFTPPPEQTANRAVAIKYIVTNKKGSLESCKESALSRSPGIVYSRLFKATGSPVRPPQTNHDRIGVVIARGKTRESAIGRAEEAFARFKLSVR